MKRRSDHLAIALLALVRLIRNGARTHRCRPEDQWKALRQTSSQEDVFPLLNERLKRKRLSRTIDVSETTVMNILHKYLGMSEVSARWVPKNLSSTQRKVRRYHRGDDYLEYTARCFWIFEGMVE